MNNNNDLQGPYETSIEVHVINDNGETGEVTISLSMGKPPTDSDIQECLAKALEAIKENGFRLMNKREFFNAMMRKRLGATEIFAVPGDQEWDAPPAPIDCLAAAAPDLLAALEGILAITDRNHVAWETARNAISKAKGAA